MARRICREDNGEIRFDYDMAIADAVRRLRADPEDRHVAAVQGAWEKAATGVRGEISDLLSADALAKMRDAVPECSR